MVLSLSVVLAATGCSKKTDVTSVIEEDNPSSFSEVISSSYNNAEGNSSVIDKTTVETDKQGNTVLTVTPSAETESIWNNVSAEVSETSDTVTETNNNSSSTTNTSFNTGSANNNASSSDGWVDGDW